MPRMAGVSGRSMTWLSRVKPRPLTTNLCFTGEQIAERTHLMCTFPDPAFDVVFVAILTLFTAARLM